MSVLTFAMISACSFKHLNFCRVPVIACGPVFGFCFASPVLSVQPHSRKHPILKDGGELSVWSLLRVVSVDRAQSAITIQTVCWRQWEGRAWVGGGLSLEKPVQSDPLLVQDPLFLWLLAASRLLWEPNQILWLL